MRKEIETLAMWYIPVCVITLIISSTYITYFIGDMVKEPGTRSTFLFWVLHYIKFADNLVIGIWLYVQTKRDLGKRWIWALFGFVANLFAVLFYLGVKLYEEQKEKKQKQDFVLPLI